MPVTWDDSSDKQMLLNIIHVLAPSPPKWEQIASMMGEGYTGEAVRKRFGKLKNQAKEQFGEPAPVETPTKSSGKPAKEKKTSVKRSSKKDSDKADEPGEEESPSKKAKTETGDGDDEEA